MVIEEIFVSIQCDRGKPGAQQQFLHIFRHRVLRDLCRALPVILFYFFPVSLCPVRLFSFAIMMDHRPVVRLHATLADDTQSIRPRNVYSIDQILGTSTTSREQCDIKDGECDLRGF